MGEGISLLSKSDETKVGKGSGTFNAIAPWFGMQSGRSSDTVIIFDWDDTLLCSSAINMQQWTGPQLEQLEITVEAILCASMALGETMIVTNGNKSWVQDSARRFLPKLLPLLNRLRVISARAIYEARWPGDPFAWKRVAFKEILAERQRSSADVPSDGLNLIVLGDSLGEIQAAQTATESLDGQSTVKTLKFKEMPSVNELLGQIRAANQFLYELVHEETSSCKGLVPRTLPPHLKYLTSWASGWRITEHRIGSPLNTASASPLTLTSASPLTSPSPVSHHDVAPRSEPQSPVTLAGG